MTVVRSTLFSLPTSATPAAAAAALATWASEHEHDLAFPGGLTTARLQFVPADNAMVEQGSLRLYRLRQFYRASSTLPNVPVTGEGSLITLEAGPAGVVAIKGTIIDPRRPYAYATSQASAATAIASIREHTSTRSGVPVSQISVSTPVLVAVPHVEQIGWYALAYDGFQFLGRVTVSADPAAAILPPIGFDTGVLDGLENTVPITVRTQDKNSDPWPGQMFAETNVSELLDGSMLLGSTDDFSGDTQLADIAIVTVDVQGGDATAFNDPTTFSRFTSATDMFTASQPSDAFYAQRTHELLRNAYAAADRVAFGRWDSALQFYRPMEVTGYPAGTFSPRVIALFNHASLNGPLAQHFAFAFSSQGQISDALMRFPEIVQRFTPSDFPDVVNMLRLPVPDVNLHTLLHEFGHAVDTSLGPGVARHHIPTCTENCDMTCDEDTTDEAYPLDETVGQMVALWMMRRLLPISVLPHGRCDVITKLAGSTDYSTIVHSPDCFTEDSQLSLFLRDSLAPPCEDISSPITDSPRICDKPYNHATNPGYGDPNNCSYRDDYATVSIFQAWWNSLNGVYCDPTWPVTCYNQTVVWPPGCGQGTAPSCVTADEAAALAFVYTLRTNPLSYVEFFDAMARFVACNYGETAYDVFNQALCDHAIRPCDAPLPMLCETCGNGVREGSEACDGLDITIDALGVVQACTDYGYSGGWLACTATCELDFTDCAPTEGSSGTQGGDNGDGDMNTGNSGSSGGADDDPPEVDNGCGCTTRGDALPDEWWLAILLLGLPRRRQFTAAVLSAGVLGCGPSVAGPGDNSADPKGDTTNQSGSSTNLDGVDGWPERWYGQYYGHSSYDMDLELGVPILMSGLFYFFYNIRVEPDAVVVESFEPTGNPDSTGSTRFSAVVDGDGLVILPLEGRDDVDWSPFLQTGMRQEMHPARDCAELELETVYQDGTTYVSKLRRGRICLVEPCVPVRPDFADCTVTVDLCTDDPAPTTCE